MKKLNQTIAIAAVTAAISLMSAGDNEAFSSKWGTKGSNQKYSGSSTWKFTPPLSQPIPPGNDTMVQTWVDLKVVGNPTLCFTDRVNGGKVTIKNVGNMTSKPSTTKIAFPGKPRLVPTPALKPGESITLTGLYRPSGVGDGSRGKIRVDFYNTNNESNERNNEKVFTCIL
ncbi:MAG: hypothetical protein NPINA01_02670 [Nitrospinaceae bacterium]|nr:MAG: hypothetical protein NPINA01_02670 [Nitrospinaceae bacterium]